MNTEEHQPRTGVQADKYVIDALHNAQSAFEATMNLETPLRQRGKAVWSYIHHVSVAVLYECLAQVDIELARRARYWIEGATEDSTAAEWVYEARQAIAQGERVSLPFEADRTFPTEWRDCTPELLASGVHCPTSPRRPSPDPDRSHQHLVNQVRVQPGDAG